MSLPPPTTFVQAMAAAVDAVNKAFGAANPDHFDEDFAPGEDDERLQELRELFDFSRYFPVRTKGGLACLTNDCAQWQLETRKSLRGCKLVDACATPEEMRQRRNHAERVVEDCVRLRLHALLDRLRYDLAHRIMLYSKLSDDEIVFDDMDNNVVAQSNVDHYLGGGKRVLKEYSRRATEELQALVRKGEVDELLKLEV